MKSITVTLHRVFNKGHLCFEIPNNPVDKEGLRQILSYCRDKKNDYISVTLTPPRRPRSTGDHSQNHHLNGHIMQICADTGNDYETVKTAVKMIACESFGYPYAEFQGVIVPQSESKASTEECAYLIEAAHLLAADLGIILKEE